MTNVTAPFLTLPFSIHPIAIQAKRTSLSIKLNFLLRFFHFVGARRRRNLDIHEIEWFMTNWHYFWFAWQSKSVVCNLFNFIKYLQKLICTTACFKWLLLVKREDSHRFCCVWMEVVKMKLGDFLHLYLRICEYEYAYLNIWWSVESIYRRINRNNALSQRKIFYFFVLDHQWRQKHLSLWNRANRDGNVYV